jgi:hypothetical protein
MKDSSMAPERVPVYQNGGISPPYHVPGAAP